MGTVAPEKKRDLSSLHRERLRKVRQVNIELGKLKLGKLPPRYDQRTLQLANYLHLKKPLPPELPLAPTVENWEAGIRSGSWGMMKNDTVGDCTCAAAGHLIMEWTLNAGKQEAIVSDENIIKAYSNITGYNPLTGANDTGAAEIDVLNYWRKKGIGGHKITAYMALEPGNHEHVKVGVYAFVGCYIGLNLPKTAQSQQVWSVPPGGSSGDGAPGSWGGHAVPVVAYDPFTLTVVTWGRLQTMTWGFWDMYCDEAYAILSPDFLNKEGLTASGFDMQALDQDLQDL